ncbi:hypothetical protein LCGC14_0675960 [marine sediment metagenome]|uniref:Sulphate adenylyltransferase catalytic domain-containing protein n=1 Tax=marine sediment metagenome TaxID=412755 RepID=A0A0F9QPL0_9ZZZZ
MKGTGFSSVSSYVTYVLRQVICSIEAYKALIKEYYPKNRVVLSTFETEMRYTGPKEAIFHAIAKKNYGCDYIIIGRDHAGGW